MTKLNHISINVGNILSVKIVPKFIITIVAKYEFQEFLFSPNLKIIILLLKYDSYTVLYLF